MMCARVQQRPHRRQGRKHVTFGHDYKPMREQRQLSFGVSFCRPVCPGQLCVRTRGPAVDHSVTFFVCHQIRLQGRASGGRLPGEVAQEPHPAAGGGVCGTALALPAAESFQCETEPLSCKVRTVSAPHGSHSVPLT